MLTSLPNLLTLSRIALIPAMIGAFYVDSPVGNWIAFAVFAAAGITDYFDGLLARSWNQQSALGRFLDPIADKLLVAAAILMLVAFRRIDGLHVLAAIVILCREILVSGLREFLAEVRVSVPVSRLAKWKTAVQMVAIGVLLVGDAAGPGIPAAAIGTLCLWLAALLTLVTGFDYLRAGLRHMGPEAPAAKPAPKAAPAPSLGARVSGP
jgi:cardiolipin synthase